MKFDMKKIKSEAKQFCYALMLYIFVVLMPPTVYAIAFCEPNWEAFATMWKNAFELWLRIVFFILLLLFVIVGILVLLFTIVECESDED
jgi:hypothetical protein